MSGGNWPPFPMNIECQDNTKALHLYNLMKPVVELVLDLPKDDLANTLAQSTAWKTVDEFMNNRHQIFYVFLYGSRIGIFTTL